MIEEEFAMGGFGDPDELYLSTATLEELYPPGWQEERIIRQETAKLAKEKGFNWYVNTHYGESPVVSHMMLAEPEDQFGTPYEKKNYNEGGWMFNKYSAPTQTFLQKWLREKHRIDVNPSRSYTRGGIDLGYSLSVERVKPNYLGEYLYGKTYEEVLEKGLVEALNLI